MEKLQDFVGLRVRYVFAVLKEAVSEESMAATMDEPLRKSLLDVAAAVESCPRQGPQPNARQELFQLLLVFDSMQFARYWVTEWHGLLSKMQSVEDLKQKLATATQTAGCGSGASGLSGANQSVSISSQTLSKLAAAEQSDEAQAHAGAIGLPDLCSKFKLYRYRYRRLCVKLSRLSHIPVVCLQL